MFNYINTLSRKSIFNSRIGLVRFVLALGALLTLLFNNIDLITSRELLNLGETATNTRSFISDYSIFFLLDNKLARILAIAILLWSMIGYFPKISIFFQTWIHLSICNSFIIVEGGDQIASNLCLLLIPICLMDKRKNHWQKNEAQQVLNQPYKNIIANVYFFLIKIQVCVIYLHAAVGKLGVDEWLNGTCSYYWMSSNAFGTLPIFQGFVELITLSTFAPLISWSVILLELALFACILSVNKRVKESFLCLGILFHFSIVLAFGLVSFYFSMCGALLLYLDDDNTFAKTIIKYIKLAARWRFRSQKYLATNMASD